MSGVMQQAGTGTDTATTAAKWAAAWPNFDLDTQIELAAITLVALGEDAAAARIDRGAALARAEWDTIPRYDPDHDDTIGVVHGHAVYLPGDPEAAGRCDCLDHRHRGVVCKHLYALQIVETVAEQDRHNALLRAVLSAA